MLPLELPPKLVAKVATCTTLADTDAGIRVDLSQPVPVPLRAEGIRVQRRRNEARDTFLHRVTTAPWANQHTTTVIQHLEMAGTFHSGHAPESVSFDAGAITATLDEEDRTSRIQRHSTQR